MILCIRHWCNNIFGGSKQHSLEREHMMQCTRHRANNIFGGSEQHSLERGTHGHLNIFGGSEQHSLEWPGACDSMHSTQYLTSH